MFEIQNAAKKKKKKKRTTHQNDVKFKRIVMEKEEKGIA